MPKKRTPPEMEQAISRDERQLAQGNQRLIAAESMVKADEKLAALYSRKARTHRLCKRGAMLEKFLPSPDLLTDDQVMSLLCTVFGKPETQEAIMLELTNQSHTDTNAEQNPDRRNYTPSR